MMSKTAMEQQADAWNIVWELLEELDPEFFFKNHGPTGVDVAVNTIRCWHEKATKYDELRR